MSPEPGIYKNVDFDTYRSWDCINNSSLKHAEKSLAHYRRYLDNPPDRTTDAFRFGSFAHGGKLEPMVACQHYVVEPDLTKNILRADGTEYSNPKATKEYRDRVAAFEAANAGKEVVPQKWFDRFAGMANALDENETARRWLRSDGDAELSIVWDDPVSGLRCKGRIDKLPKHLGIAVDLKTTADASDFERSIAKYGYHRQAAFYCDGLSVLTGRVHGFGIIAVEKDEPFGVRAAPMSGESLAVGRQEYRSLLNKIAAARNSDRWPGYESPEAWNLPNWASPKVELLIGGQVINVK